MATKDEVIITRSQTVMTIPYPPETIKENGYVKFFAQDFDTKEEDQTESCFRVLEMTTEDWKDLGEPLVITITIEPGDKLNG